MATVGPWIAEQHPDLPRFLIGHSMGSFALQQVIVDHSELWSGVVLSGTTALDCCCRRWQRPVAMPG